MKFPTHISVTSVLLLCVIAFPSFANAQENLLPCDEVEYDVLEQTPDGVVELITAFNPAQPIDKASPRYPKSAARASAEGWVKMSYVIDTNGNVQDPVIEDFGGHKSFKHSALSAIKKWKFDPAIKDGKPTEQCHQSVQFDFTLGDNLGASRRFISQYRKAEALINSQDYATAEKLIQKMHEDSYRNRYENAWLWSVDVKLANKLGDSGRELKSLKRTIASSQSHSAKNKTFGNEYMTYVYQRLFTLEAKLGRFADAIKTLESLKAIPNGEESLKPIEDAITYVSDYLASDNHIFVKVELKDAGEYFHLLARNDFAFANIKGKVDTVEVRCESQRQKFTVAEDFIWSIPASWGQCQVMIKGDSQTTFELIEVGKV